MYTDGEKELIKVLKAQIEYVWQKEMKALHLISDDMQIEIPEGFKANLFDQYGRDEKKRTMIFIPRESNIALAFIDFISLHMEGSINFDTSGLWHSKSPTVARVQHTEGGRVLMIYSFQEAYDKLAVPSKVEYIHPQKHIDGEENDTR